MLKDDQASIRNLGNVVLTISNGAIHFSQKAHQLLLRNRANSEADLVLTPRQLQTLSLCQAYPNDSTSELAEKMAVANSTVRNLLSGAYVKLGVHTRSAAISKARQLGLITPDPQSPLV